MLDTFYIALTPMLTLALCILVGFLLRKFGVLPDNAGKVMAKLETWVFLPALTFSTMVRYCTVDTLTAHGKNLLLSFIGVCLAITLSILLSPCFAKRGSKNHGVYLYALAFANSGYMGDPLVIALFGNEILSYYKVYCLPISLMIYTWGISRMIPRNKAKGGAWRRIVNPPTVALVLGMLAGICGLGKIMPSFASDALSKLGACMGPVAMLLAGFTIAGYSMMGMLKNKRIYAASLLRLTVIPSAIIGILFCVKSLLCLLSLEMDNSVLFLTFFAIGTPLGLNTVVFPEAYGGDAELGAGMTLISHTLCIITIPLMYAAMIELFGMPFGL